MISETTLLTKYERKILGGVVNLFLQLKVSYKSNYKIESIDLSSIKVQLLSCCYCIQAKIYEDEVWLEIWLDLPFGNNVHICLYMAS